MQEMEKATMYFLFFVAILFLVAQVNFLKQQKILNDIAKEQLEISKKQNDIYERQLKIIEKQNNISIQ